MAPAQVGFKKQKLCLWRLSTFFKTAFSLTNSVFLVRDRVHRIGTRESEDQWIDGKVNPTVFVVLQSDSVPYG